MLSYRGLPAKDLILGTDAADYILADEKTRQLLDKNSGIIVGEIRQQLTQYDGVVFMGVLNFGGFMLNVFSVDETYEDENGKVVAIHAEADLETRNGNPADGRKVRGTIHWVSCEHCVDAEIHLYDKLFTEANMNGIPDGADFKDYLNPDSVQVIDHAKLEESLADAKPGERFQFVRTGYFTPDSKNPHVYNRIVTLKDSFKF